MNEKEQIEKLFEDVGTETDEQITLLQSIKYFWLIDWEARTR